MSPWWTPVIKEAIGGFVQDLFLSNNRTRPSRNLTMGESATTSILTFNGRAQRPPDSSCLRDDTISFSRTTAWHWSRYSSDHDLSGLRDDTQTLVTPLVQLVMSITRYYFGVTHLLSRTTFWHWSRYSLEHVISLRMTFIIL